MKKRVISFVFIIGLILSFSFVSADFTKGNITYSIESSYGPSENIRGWINISLENEPIDSMFEDGESNSMSLINLLETNLNKDFYYTCNPLSCKKDYSLIGEGKTSKIFDLAKGESKIFGFALPGEISDINSIDFTIVSDAPSSCNNQLEVNFFGDEEFYLKNNQIKDQPPCLLLKEYNCFNPAEENITSPLTKIPFCQKIFLSESPGFKLGAWVNKTKAGDGVLTMKLYDITETAQALESCELNTEDLSELERGEEISCDIEYLSQSQYYYVCISSSTDNKEYSINRNSHSSNPCGFYHSPKNIEDPPVAAYHIFSEGKKFLELEGNPLHIENLFSNGKDIGLEAYEYLESVYGGISFIDCPVTGCIIPLEFKSNIDQEIKIEGLTIDYETTSGGLAVNNFYNLTESVATISADFQKMFLDEGNFSVQDNLGSYDFLLSLSGEDLVSEEVLIGQVATIKSLTPRTTASAYPTEFEVTIESDIKIKEYKWDFGDDNVKTTVVNKVTHTYNSVGEKELTVTITDENQKVSSKMFTIDVGSSRDIINKLLPKMTLNLNHIKTQINSFGSFIKDSLNSVLGVSSLENKLENIQKANASAKNNNAYNSILTDLLALNIPNSIEVISSADLILFHTSEEDIDLDILRKIGGGEYNSSEEEEYINSILLWNQENIEAKITFKELSANYDYFTDSILRTFELKVDKKSGASNPYLIFDKLDNLEFGGDYSDKEESDHVYIYLDESEKTILFSTTEDIDFIDLPLFISPKISELSLTAEDPDGRDKLLKVALFIAILFFLGIIGFIVYLVLQVWYKKKYEGHLFKNQNDLYNLISYIQSSKKKGLENKEIVSKLKKSGWKSEQVSYITKKYLGKRTGMLEIPVGKILGKIKKNKVKTLPQRKSVGRFQTRQKTGFNQKRNLRRFR